MTSTRTFGTALPRDIVCKITASPSAPTAPRFRLGLVAGCALRRLSDAQARRRAHRAAAVRRRGRTGRAGVTDLGVPTLALRRAVRACGIEADATELAVAVFGPVAGKRGLSAPAGRAAVDARLREEDRAAHPPGLTGGGHAVETAAQLPGRAVGGPVGHHS